jgi:hypothetical protein
VRVDRLRPARHRSGAILAGVGLLAAAALGAHWLRPPATRLLPPPARFSLLALGDTGQPPGWFPGLEGQSAVAAGLEQEDRRAPIDGLLLLGDNFYEKGLEDEELLRRVHANIVVPYCRFVGLDGPRSAEVSSGCKPDRALPARIYAVLGNHDLGSPESRRLQIRELPRFVSNWEMSEQRAEALEIADGVSLIVFDSSYLRDSGDPGPLRAALAASRGPWRILAAHHPVGTSRDRNYKKERGVGAYGGLVEDAIRDARTPVQLMLAGHEHNLQLLERPEPGPRLVAISGGGSSPGAVKSKSTRRLFSYVGLGFARVDLIRDSGRERLMVSFFASPRWRSWLGAAPEVLERWSVTVGGDLLTEPLSVRVLESS